MHSPIIYLLLLHKRLLSAFNLGADWYDESGRLVDKLVGRTHEIAPKRAIYEVKNGHLYRYDEDLEALFKRADEEVVSRIEKPSDRYPLSKNKSVRVFINQPDEIIKFDRSDYAKGTRFDVRLNSPLHSFLKTLRTTCSLDPDVAFSGAGLTPTRVSFNADGHAFSFSNPISAGCMQVCVDQFVPDEAYLTRYDDLSRAFFESIARSKNLSNFWRGPRSTTEGRSRDASAPRSPYTRRKWTFAGPTRRRSTAWR